MKVTAANDIKEEISRKYDHDPRGWHAAVGRDEENYFTSLFTHNKDFWLIKEFPVNPYQTIGCGTMGKIGGNKGLRDLKSQAEFGLRPVAAEQSKALLEGHVAVIDEILKTPTMPSERCSSFPLVMGGPIARPTQRMFISPAQQRLEGRLRKNLREMVARRYPGLARSYR